jgi:hypothetical protein
MPFRPRWDGPIPTSTASRSGGERYGMVLDENFEDELYEDESSMTVLAALGGQATQFWARASASLGVI